MSLILREYVDTFFQYAHHTVGTLGLLAKALVSFALAYLIYQGGALLSKANYLASAANSSRFQQAPVVEAQR